jgi:uncharacterized protein YqgV (UPF0045/DUF77 family)
MLVVYPLDRSHLGEEAARVVKTLNGKGLEYWLGPLSISVEGDWEEVMGAIRDAVKHPCVQFS